MRIPEVPHAFDMYAQPDERMQRFRDHAAPWLNKRSAKSLLSELTPLAQLLIDEPDLENIPKKYGDTLTLERKFQAAELTLGPRHIVHLIGAGLREQAMKISNNQYYITPVLPGNFAVSPRIRDDILVAKGTNSPEAGDPALDAQLAWLIKAPTPENNSRQAQLTLVGRRILPECTDVRELITSYGINYDNRL